MMTSKKNQTGRSGMGVLASRDTILFQSALISAPEEGNVFFRDPVKKTSLAECSRSGKYAQAMEGYEAFVRDLPFPKETLPETRVCLIPSRVQTELSLRFEANGQRAALSLFIILEEGSKLFVRSEIGGGRNASTLLFVHFFLAPKAELACVEANTSDAESASFVSAEVSEGASARFWSFVSSESLAFSRRHFRLFGDGAEVLDSAALSADAHGVTDIFSSAEHAAPKTISKIFSHAAVSGHAKSMTQSNIRIHKGARKSEGREDTRVLLLSDTAEADPVPHLEIGDDDVRCSHGASVSRLRDEMIFFCALRGIGESEARRLLLKGFFEEVFVSAPEAVKEFLGPKIESSLTGKI